MSLPRSFATFAEFEREFTSNRVGISLEDMMEESSFDAEIEFDKDPFDEVDEDDDY